MVKKKRHYGGSLTNKNLNETVDEITFDSCESCLRKASFCSPQEIKVKRVELYTEKKSTLVIHVQQFFICKKALTKI